MKETLKMRFAYMFAKIAHRGQKRKYTNEPYVNHCERVADNVRLAELEKDAFEPAICAAYLHDVVEDTWVKHWMIELLFGSEISILVWELTNPSKEHPNLRRAERKEMDRVHLSDVSPIAQTIKLCDMLDNISDFLLYDPKFCKVVMPEMRNLVKVLCYGDKGLYSKVYWMVEGYFYMNKNEGNPNPARK